MIVKECFQEAMKNYFNSVILTLDLLKPSVSNKKTPLLMWYQGPPPQQTQPALQPGRCVVDLRRKVNIS